MRHNFLRLLVAVCGLAVLSAAAGAQTPPDGIISVNASENVHVQPTLLRLETRIQAKGETPEKAVAKLLRRREKVMAKLKQLKADEASIRWKAIVISLTPPQANYGPGPAAPPAPGGLFVPAPTAAPATAPGPATYQPTPANAHAADKLCTTTGGDAADDSDSPPGGGVPGFTASMAMHAQWALTARDPGAIALAGEALRDKLAAARLFGMPETATPATPEAVPVMPAGAFQPPSATLYPSFVSTYSDSFQLRYVGTISAAQRKTALAAALVKAKDRAGELADAAGSRLGKIRSLTGDVNNDISMITTVVGTEAGTVAFPRTNDLETVSTTPEIPDFSVHVAVTYAIIQPDR